MITRIRHLLEYGLARFLIATVHSLGYERSLAVARGLAAIFYRVGKKQRRRALRNIEKAMPETTPEERERIARQSFGSFMRTFLEGAWCPRLLSPGRLPKIARFEVHPDAEPFFRPGVSVIFVSGHFGNWELTGHLLALRGHDLATVARTLDNPLLDAYVTRVRTKFGMRIIRKDGGVRSMARMLREGKTVAVLADQATGRRGIIVDFMGRPASTTPAPAMLAVRFGVPLIPGRGYWSGNGREYVLKAEAPLTIPHSGSRDEDVRIMTEEINRVLAGWVRERPGDWLWVHRRWKMRRDWVKAKGATDEA